MAIQAFDTKLQEQDGVLNGPFRFPVQMLAEQEYGGHLSIHDDDQAEKLGFSGAPIEGPTHFSQFDPLLHKIWGDRWFEQGCISSHFKTMVVEGEEVQAFAEIPEANKNITKIWATKKTGEPVLEGTASVGPDHPESRLDALMASRPTPTHSSCWKVSTLATSHLKSTSSLWRLINIWVVATRLPWRVSSQRSQKTVVGIKPRKPVTLPGAKPSFQPKWSARWWATRSQALKARRVLRSACLQISKLE